mmetsp:Transcript_125752/g.367482  ORF Transcript_125752/g.367482 Transcript_125752/m.367482 type:complete len:200 (+) Transcript_125752:98-697(+)
MLTPCFGNMPHLMPAVESKLHLAASAPATCLDIISGSQHIAGKVQGTLRLRGGHHTTEVRVGGKERLSTDNNEVAAGSREGHIQPPGAVGEPIMGDCGSGAAAAEDGDLSLTPLEGVNGRSLHAFQSYRSECTGASLSLAAVEADDTKILWLQLAATERAPQPKCTKSRLVVMLVGLASPHFSTFTDNNRKRWPTRSEN